MPTFRPYSRLPLNCSSPYYVISSPFAPLHLMSFNDLIVSLTGDVVERLPAPNVDAVETKSHSRHASPASMFRRRKKSAAHSACANRLWLSDTLLVAEDGVGRLWLWDSRVNSKFSCWHSIPPSPHSEHAPSVSLISTGGANGHCAMIHYASGTGGVRSFYTVEWTVS